MRSIIVIALICIFFVLALTSRIAGLYTYWWFGVFRPQDWVFSSFLSELRVPLIAAFLLVVPSLIEKKVPKFNNPIAILMLLMLLALVVADVINGCGVILTQKTSDIFDIFVLFYVALLMTAIVDSKRKLYWLIAVIALSLAVHSGKHGIYALLTGANYYGLDLMGGMFSGSNAYALGCGVLLFFMIFTFQHVTSAMAIVNHNSWYKKPIVIKIYKLILITLIIGTYYNIVALQSRGAFIATSLGLLLWILVHKNNIRMLIVAAVVVVSVISVVKIPTEYQDRIRSAFVEQEELDDSAASRPFFWGVAMDMVADHPLGVGPGCYPEYYDKYDSSNGLYGHYRSVHSSHFQILADAGYFGVFIWVVLFLVSYWKLFKIRRMAKKEIREVNSTRFYVDVSNMLLCAMTVFALGGSFYELAYIDIIWLIFCLIIVVEKCVINEINNVATRSMKAKHL